MELELYEVVERPILEEVEELSFEEASFHFSAIMTAHDYAVSAETLVQVSVIVRLVS